MKTIFASVAFALVALTAGVAKADYNSCYSYGGSTSCYGSSGSINSYTYGGSTFFNGQTSDGDYYSGNCYTIGGYTSCYSY